MADRCRPGIAASEHSSPSASAAGGDDGRMVLPWAPRRLCPTSRPTSAATLALVALATFALSAATTVGAFAVVPPAGRPPRRHLRRIRPALSILDDPIVAAPDDDTGGRGPGATFGGDAAAAGEGADVPLSGIASRGIVLEEVVGAPPKVVVARPPPLRWDVYVCQSKPCRERGSGATLDAFVGLVPPGLSDDGYVDEVGGSEGEGADAGLGGGLGGGVAVHPAILSRAKGKGPIVRCIASRSNIVSDRGGGRGDDERREVIRAFEVQNVDSVDKVYRILTKHMDIEGIDISARECLKWNYKGNAHLEKGEISDAIESYDRAIESAGRDPEREGRVLLMRATAYLKRAFNHQIELKRVVSDLAEAVPDPVRMAALYGAALDGGPAIALPIFRRVMSDCRSQDRKFRQIKYRHGLYEYALLRAARDSLRSTQLLPGYARAWLRAGDSLAELRKLRESAQYYERAMELDPMLEETLVPVVERLRKSQDFLDRARANGWSEDTLRLALDVAG